MNYPARLLPKSSYRKIALVEELLPLFLLRHTPTKDILLPSTNEINPDNLKIQSDHLKDLSTNLLGEFTVDDNKIEIIERDKDFFDDWIEADSLINVPRFNEDFVINEERGYIYFNIKDVISMRLSHETADKILYNLIFKIIHTPTKCNFWHFSIRVFANNEEISTSIIGKGLKKILWRKAKEQLIQCASIDSPKFSMLDSKNYIKG